ncbi:MAG: SHOCT domain-containing protein, partial [Actinomycetota bacterium]|nr:SHOCT domain-containing protein [Actinomycetota bacterium]
MASRAGPRIALISAVLAMVAGVAGLIVSIVLNVFVFDEFDAYGEVPIPGQGRLQLPAGEATVSFHTQVPGGMSNAGFPVPPLELSLTSPEGVPDPVVTDSVGATTSVNSDVRIRLWVAQIPEQGVYDVAVRGNVGGYINPQLAFGRNSSMWWLTWVSGGLIAAGVVGLFAGVLWRLRSGGPAPPPAPISLDEPRYDQPSWPGPLPPPVDSHEPSDQGVRLEQLKTLAALRDSGALTEAEFQA